MSTPLAAPAAQRRPRRFRWLPYVAGLAVLTLLVLGLRPKPAPVETGRVVYGPLRAVVSEEGKTRIKQRYVVSAPVSGSLRRIDLKPGAKIDSPTMIVAVIDPAPASPLDARTRAMAQARFDAATVLLEKARAAHQLARSELHRVEQMFSAATVSPQDLENAQRRETAASTDVASAEGALRQAQAELDQITVPADANPSHPAPIEVKASVVGSVLHVFQESARIVVPGTPLVEIGDPTDLEVAIEMLSRDAAAIPPGAAVEFDQWGGPQPLQGRVRLIEPAAFTKISALGVEEQRAYVVCDITTPLNQRLSLGDNFRVEAHVILWQNDRVLKIPTSALFRGEKGEWTAYVLRNGRAELTALETGQSSGAETQILSGLKEGDDVILYPGDRVKPGQRVQPIQVTNQ